MAQENQKSKAVAYCRISTPTLLHGQSIENQLEPIKAFALARGFDLVHSYSDEVSGSTERRRGLDQMVVDAKKGQFKVLIVMEISRLARDVRHLLNLLHSLDEIGVSVISIREGIEFNSTMGRAMVAMIGILMSVERDLLRERIRTALAVKKLTAQRTNNGWRCGRPPLDNLVLAQVATLRSQGMSVRQIAKQLGLGKTTVSRALAGPKPSKKSDGKNE